MPTPRARTKICLDCRRLLPATKEHFGTYINPRTRRKTVTDRCSSCLRKRREYSQRWLQTPEAQWVKLKSHRGAHNVLINKEAFVQWYKSKPRKCAYCDLPEILLRYVPDLLNSQTFSLSIDKIDSSRPYEIGNLGLCCRRCNQVKSNFFTASEMREIGQKVIKPKWEPTMQRYHLRPLGDSAPPKNGGKTLLMPLDDHRSTRH